MADHDVRGEDYEAARPVPARSRVTGDPWVRDHLPECPLATICKHDYYDEPPVQCANCGEECLCHRLRAAEARVEEAMDRAWTHTLRVKQSEAYANGVQAARDAVARARWTGEALAAIDALRGEA